MFIYIIAKDRCMYLNSVCCTDKLMYIVCQTIPYFHATIKIVSQVFQ